MGGFSNPLVGGGGALVYPSIHSPNFNINDPAASPQPSWAVLKNGESYFTAVNLIDGSIQFYVGGVLVASLGFPFAGALILESESGTDLQFYSISNNNGTLLYIFPSGDVSGVTDANNISGAAAAAEVNGGVINLVSTNNKPYYVEAGIVTIPPGVYLRGPGRNACLIKGTGTGDVIAMYGTGSSSALAGGLTGFTVDGSSCGAGSTGFHIGDMLQMDLDIAAQNFTGAGSIGVHADNRYTYTEQVTGKVYVTNNANGVVFDNSADLSGGATGSFDRWCADIFLISAGAGNGVTFQNGALIADPDFGIYGNMTTAATPYACLTVTGDNAGGFSRILRGTFNVGVELRNIGGVAPYSILWGTPGSNVIQDCVGIMDFSSNAAFTNTNNYVGTPYGSIRYDGPIYGDIDLQRSNSLGRQPYEIPALVNGDTINTTFPGLIHIDNTGNVTGIFMQANTSDEWREITIINYGIGSITFAAVGSNVADGNADVIAVNTAAKFVWDPFQFLWYRMY